MEAYTIRAACLSDARSVLDIYGPYVAATPTSFEVEVPTEAEMRRRMEVILPMYPWLVAEEDGRVFGYAYGSQHRPRRAYQWSAEVTVYLAPQAHRRGIGKALYARLLKILEYQGFHGAYAGITLPNDASVKLHEAVGFEPIGIYREMGYKLDQWWDVGWFRLGIGPAGKAPKELKPFEQLVGSAELIELLA